MANVVGSSEKIAVAQAVCSEKLIGVVLNGKLKGWLGPEIFKKSRIQQEL